MNIIKIFFQLKYEAFCEQTDLGRSTTALSHRPGLAHTPQDWDYGERSQRKSWFFTDLLGISDTVRCAGR